MTNRGVLGGVAKLPSGLDGQVLTTDSTQSGGAKWASLQAGWGFRSGWYYGPPMAASTGAAFGSNGQVVYMPVFVPVAVTIQSLHIEITTLGGTGATVRLGAYITGADGMPSALIVDGSTIDATSTGVKTATVSATLPPGLIWLCAAQQGAASNCQARVFNQTGLLPGAADTFQSSAICGLLLGTTVTTGALPATATAPTGASGATSTPVLRFRAA